MKAPNQLIRYLSVAELDARWGEHPNTVYRRVAAPEWLDAVRSIQLGRQLRFLDSDVDAYEDARRLTAVTALGDEAESGPSLPDGVGGSAERTEPAVTHAPPASEFSPRRPPVRRRAAA